MVARALLRQARRVEYRGAQEELLSARLDWSTAPDIAAAFGEPACPERALRRIRGGEALVWRGDYHRGRQLLVGLRKLAAAEGPLAALPADLGERFLRERRRKGEVAEVQDALLVAVDADYTLPLPRAPREQLRSALAAALGPPESSGFLLPLQLLVGVVAAWQAREKGVPVPALGGARVHPRFGVFAPTRAEYLDLLPRMCAELGPAFPRAATAIDLGTGTGALAAVALHHGLASRVLCIDNSPLALDCARDNLERLGHAASGAATFEHSDGLPKGKRADLLLCNPPWLPVQPRSLLDLAVYDPNSAMLRGFLSQARGSLRPGGRAFLVISDLAERLGLRDAADLPRWIAESGLAVEHEVWTPPAHGKARRTADPLHEARAQERVRLLSLVPDDGSY